MPSGLGYFPLRAERSRMHPVDGEASWVEAMPEIYDRALGPALFIPYAEHLAGLASQLAPRRVLELAAGTGIVTAALVRALPQADIVATDLNTAMVSWAAERIAGATWQQADAQSLDFPADSFDLAVCAFGVMFFPDRPGAYAQTARVLVPEGKLLLTVWDTVVGSPFPTALVDSLAAVFPDDPPDWPVRVPYGYADPDRIRVDLQAGGLQVDTLDRVVLRGTAPSARTVAEGFCLGSPLRFALQERGPLEVLAERMALEMEARLGPGPLESELAAFVVAASAPA